MKWPSHHVNAIRNQKVIPLWNSHRCEFCHVNTPLDCKQGTERDRRELPTGVWGEYESEFLARFPVVSRQNVSRVFKKIIFTSQTAELLQVYGGQMDMIFSVHVNNGRVSIVGNIFFCYFTDNFAVSWLLIYGRFLNLFKKNYARSRGFQT